MTHMNWGYVIASLQTCISFAACAGYAFQKDWKHAAYWLFAAGLTAVVTWWF